MRDPIVPIAYIPYQLPWHKETIMVRVSASDKTAPAALASLVRRAVSRAGPEFRVANIRTEEGMLQAQMVRERLLARLAVFFGSIALLVAGIGLYGVLDYSVARRRHEIGIRLAIGAGPATLSRKLRSISPAGFSADYLRA